MPIAQDIESTSLLLMTSINFTKGLHAIIEFLMACWYRLNFPIVY